MELSNVASLDYYTNEEQIRILFSHVQALLASLRMVIPTYHTEILSEEQVHILVP